MPRSNKRQRQNLIRRIVSEEEIYSQEELRSELLKRSVAVTQATLSRDISELGLVKHSSTGTYRLPENITEHAQSRTVLERIRQLVQEIDHSGNLVLVKTAPGDAQAAGLAMDNLRFKEVVGTVAGDDTLLVVIREKHSASTFVHKLERMLSGGGD
ncbi:MAG TPA: arginine repressor [Acidobacteriota bacterium]|jgi:transcriptional regulator of arginine metabolism|nr:arginine repressor [Acidobacteriota bacterium]